MADAIFGDVGRCHLLFRALQITFYEYFICDEDQSFCVAGAIFGDIGRWHLLFRAL